MKDIALFLLIIIVLFLTTCEKAAAEQSLQLYLNGGVYHRLGEFTSPVLRRNENGSETPGTVSLGARLTNCKWLLWARSCTFEYHHHSYLDRGKPFNDKPESHIDMWGLKVEWVLHEWRW